MKINIWKNQKEIEKTYEVEADDLMYGTLMDLFEIIDGTDLKDDSQLIKIVTENREQLNRLILDIFPEMTQDELKKTKVKELIPLLIETFQYVISTFTKRKN